MTTLPKMIPNTRCVAQYNPLPCLRLLLFTLPKRGAFGKVFCMEKHLLLPQMTASLYLGQHPVSEDMILAGTVMCTFFRKSCTENVAETGTPRDVCPPCYPLICFMLSVLAHLASFLLCLGLVIQQRMVRRAV
jgi:hypothetical protein